MGRQGTPRPDATGTSASRRASTYVRAHRARRRWLGVVGVLAAVVACVTALALSLPASTWTGAASLPEGAQVPEGYTRQYSAQDRDSGVAVAVHAADGVVPDGAQLKVDLLDEDGEKYGAARDALAEQAGEGNDYGFAALDIRFEDEKGNEVEPTGDVYVVIDAKSVLPEDVDPESVTVQHLAEDESGVVAAVDTVADATEATDGIVATEDTAVQAAFTVDGFSTFTITWKYGRYQTRTVTVHYVDQNGHEIYASDAVDLKGEVNEWIYLQDYAKDIDGFTFQSIRRDSSNGNQISQVRLRQQGNWYTLYTRNSDYENSSVWQRNDGAYNIYFVYRQSGGTAGLTTAQTVDSAAEGVHMYMFDYDSKAFDGGEYGIENGSTKTGLASSTVNSQTGWPSLTGVSDTPNNSSFSNYFGGSQSAYDLSGTLDDNGCEVNRLFLDSYYRQDGTFYYSSFENFATLANDRDNDFTVYNQLGTPDSGDSYFYQRGNFMPYNTLNQNSIANYNLYDETGDELTDEDPRVNEPLYALNESANYEFGMYVWADFYQPQDGQVESANGSSSKDMVFEFTGDDDMWVYIDGVLVLDLGGIHDAQSGSINFATGDVSYTDTETGEDPDWHYTTIKQMFQNAQKEDSVQWDGNTFVDGSYHRIQIFYMERGRGASNLKISFNLKTIPDGQLSVRKDVENYYAPQLKNITYTMQVEYWDPEESDWLPFADKSFTFFEAQGGGTTNSEGCFTLKNDQTAVFEDVEVGTRLRIREIGSSDTEEGSQISQNYSIEYTVTDSSDHEIDGGTDDGSVTASMPAYGSINVGVTNTATYTRPLRLVKNFDGTEGGAAPNGFEATYSLYEDSDGVSGQSEDDTLVGSIKYSQMTDGEYTFWLDVDKTYYVVETFEKGDNKGDTDDLKWSRYDVVTNDPAENTDSSQGIVRLETSDATLESATETNPVDSITLTNVYGDTSVDITITKVDNQDSDIKLKGAEFYLMNDESKYYFYDAANETVTWVEQRNDATLLTSGQDGTFVIHALESGTYTLVETKAPDGYQMPTNNVTFTVTGGKIESAGNLEHADNTLTVTNVSGGAMLPETGGPGTTIATFGGATLIAAAGIGYGLRHNRERRGAQS